MLCYILEGTQTIEVGLVANHERRRLVREVYGSVLLEANGLEILLRRGEVSSGQDASEKVETHADDLGILSVGLGDDSLGSRIFEEAVMHERGHPCSHAVRPTVSV